MAPQLVGEALKSAVFVASTMRALGYRVWPEVNDLRRPSFVTAIELGSAAKMVAFCRAVQRCSPVGSYVVPEPGVARPLRPPRTPAERVLVLPHCACIAATAGTRTAHGDCNSACTCVAGATPGYNDQVIFADGTFVDGSTSEMSADGPLRAPHIVYCQGGMHWNQWNQALEEVAAALTATRDTSHQEAAKGAGTEIRGREAVQSVGACSVPLSR